MKQQIKIIKIIHLAFCLGLIVAYLIIGDIKALTSFSFDVINSSNMIFLFIPIIAIILSEFLFKSQLKTMDSKLSLENKMPFYQRASIIRWAVLEGATFLILFLNKDYIIFGIFIIVYFIFIRPTEDKIKMTLV
ncbi:MAG: MFS transporter [Xanthomarina sp.]